MLSGSQTFSQVALSVFGWLSETYRFRVLRSESTNVLFTTVTCQVTVALERCDLFIEIGSNEPEPIRRIKFSLNELLAAKAIDLDSQLPSDGGDSPSLEHRLQIASELLATYGIDVLKGDFSIRPRIVEVQVRAWLEDKYKNVMEDRRYRTIEEGIQQVVLELAKHTKEKKSEAWRQIGMWMSEGGRRCEFAEQVVASL